MVVEKRGIPIVAMKPLLDVAGPLVACAGAALKGGDDLPVKPYTVNTRINKVTTDPAFGGYGRLIFPADYGYCSGDALNDLGLVWYNYIVLDKTVEICDYMKTRSQGEHRPLLPLGRLRRGADGGVFGLIRHGNLGMDRPGDGVLGKACEKVATRGLSKIPDTVYTLRYIR